MQKKITARKIHQNR